MKHEPQRSGGRQHHYQHHELVGQILRNVRVNGMDRPQQQRREQSLPHALLEFIVDPVVREVVDQQQDQKVGSKVSCGVAIDCSTVCPGNGRPDDQVDHRLQDHPKQPEHRGSTVLQIHKERGFELCAVDRQQGFHATTPCAKICSITCSIGGSSMVRSLIAHSSSRPCTTLAVAALGTRSFTCPSSLEMTSPKEARLEGSSGVCTVIVL